MVQPVSSETKKLRNTLRPHRERERQARHAGLRRITAPIAPPKVVPPELQRQWELHLELLIAAGTMAVIELRGFVAMIRCAALLEKAYAAAQKAGPVARIRDGGSKTSAAWSAWLATDAAYQRHLDAFGLRPHAHGRVTQLPSPGGPLRVVA